MAGGSGCTPGPGPLPDGTWFGYIRTTAPDSVGFDLACWFSGIGAIEAAAEDGEESPPPNDYYIRNLSSTTRTIGVLTDVTVQRLSENDITKLVPTEFAQWAITRDLPGWIPAVWIEIADGSVASITEQYQP